MDLAEWYTAGRWVGLLELIDMLPAACRLNEAVANDPEAAAALAAMHAGDGERESWAPRTSEWDLHASILGQIADGIQTLTAITLKVNGGNPGDVKPFPTPRTKIQEAMQQAEREWAEGFIEQFGFSREDL